MLVEVTHSVTPTEHVCQGDNRVRVYPLSDVKTALSLIAEWIDDFNKIAACFLDFARCNKPATGTAIELTCRSRPSRARRIRSGCGCIRFDRRRSIFATGLPAFRRRLNLTGKLFVERPPGLRPGLPVQPISGRHLAREADAPQLAQAAFSGIR